MKKVLLTFMLILSLLTPLAHAEESAPIPAGNWYILDDDVWVYQLTQAVRLNDEQRALIESGALVGTFQFPPDMLTWEGQTESLAPGTMLTYDQLAMLFPGMLDPRVITEPQIEPFELTGEWYYGEDGVLYYQHDETTRSMSLQEVFARLDEGGKPSDVVPDKVIYLTIDDTPSRYTIEMLSVLNEYNVRATFFVVGAYVRTLPKFARAIFEQGHVLANHSFNHDKDILTSSFASCLADFRRTETAVERALGFTLPMPILRIPYGASTIPASYRSGLQEKGYLWIDWNALNGDTETSVKTDADLVERAISTGRRYDTVVMLIHDGKQRTIRTLPAIIEHFQENGYEFRVLTTDIADYIDGVRMGFPK